MTCVAGEGTVLPLPDSPFDLPAHCFFAGWLVDGEGLQPGEEITVAGPMTVTALWKDTLILGQADMVLPTGLDRLETGAFREIAAESVYVPDGCSFIGEEAFADCRSLRRIRIPESCGIDGTAFEGCGGVSIFGTPGSPAEEFCLQHEGFSFVPDT